MPAPRSRLGVALAGLTLIAACAASNPTDTSAPLVPPAPEQTELAPGTRADPVVAPSDLNLGVQMFAMWRDWEIHEELMDEVVKSGSTWLRVDVGWCSLEEAGPGIISGWYQDRLDQVVAEAAERDLSLLVTLTCSPTWARPDQQLRALPADPAEYGRVADYLASRYEGKIAAWELWNEPDCLNVRCSNGDPVAYVPVLKAGYEGIKSGDPKATVLSGGLSGINLDWIRRMFEAGAGEYLDAVALNPYIAPANQPPGTPATDDYSDPYRLTNVVGAHDLLAELGYADTPIWFTEFGWSTGRTPGSLYDGVPEDVQAAYLSQAIEQVRTRYPYVTHAFWFCLRDRDDDTANENGFGLLRLDLSAKPSYGAFTDAVADIAKDKSR